jgi:hypothetical protein
MSKLIKKIIADVDALEVDDSIKEAFKNSLDALNEENKDEITRTKTKLNDAHTKEIESFAGEKAEYLKIIDGLKNQAPPEPNKELLDRLKIMEDRAKASEELAAKTEKERVEAIIDSELRAVFKDSIDPEILAERYKNRVKLVDGKLYTNDDDMTPIKDLKENIKIEKPHLWKASGIGGSGTPSGGKNTPTNGDYYSLDEINSMSESEMIANLDKVNKSAEFHAKNK